MEGTSTTSVSTSNAAKLAQAVSEVADLIQANTDLQIWAIEAYAPSIPGARVVVSVHASPGQVAALAQVIGATESRELASSDLVAYGMHTPTHYVEIWGRES
jgi:hypothetical protein